MYKYNRAMITINKNLIKKVLFLSHRDKINIRNSNNWLVWCKFYDEVRRRLKQNLCTPHLRRPHKTAFYFIVYFPGNNIAS